MPAVVLLCVLAAAALAWLGDLYLHQERLVFRPAPPLDRTPASLALPYDEVALRARDGATVRCWWVPSRAGEIAVLYLPGSEGHLTRELPSILFLHSLAANVLVVGYPGYEPGDPPPTEAGCYAAADAGYEWLTTRGFAPSRIVAFGFSLGAAVAAHVAVRHALGGLAIHSGFTSVPDMAARAYPYLPVRWFCRTKMDTIERIAHVSAPVLVVHSPDDEHVPIADGRALYRRASHPKRFVETQGSHFVTTWQRLPAVREAWAQLLAGDTRTWDGEGRA